MITKVYKQLHRLNEESKLRTVTRLITYYFLGIPFWRVKIVFPEGAGTF